MKQILEASKRALVLLLTGAMIATSVPSTAFAATVTDEDVIIEEAVDVADDVIVEEESPAGIKAVGTYAEPIANGGDSVDVDNSAPQRVLAVTDTNLANLNALVYGISINTAISKVAKTTGANAEPAGAKNPYDSVSFTLQKAKVWPIVNATTDWENYNSEYVAPGVKWEATGGTVTFTGCPTEAMDTEYYRFIITDTGAETSEDGTSADALTDVAFPVTVAGADILIDDDPNSSYTDGRDVAYTPASDKSNWPEVRGYSANTAVVVGTYKTAGAGITQGYKVLNSVTAGTEYDTDVVVPVKFTISIDGSGDAVDSSHPINDITLTNSNPDQFVVSEVTGSLYSTSDASFTVKPVEGLKSTDAAGTIYATEITVSSPKIGEYTIPVFFPVTNDISFTLSRDGKDIATTAGTAKKLLGNFGEIAVGDEITESAPLVITATGGNGNLEITKTANAYPYGLTGKSSNPGDTATYSLYGTIAEKDGSGNSTMGTYLQAAGNHNALELTATDADGNTKTLCVQLKVVGADIDVTVNDEALAWIAGTPDTASYETTGLAGTAGTAAVVKITNNSNTSLTVSGVFADNQSGSSGTIANLTADNSNLTIEKGSTATITISADNNGVADAVNVAELALSGNGIDSKSLTIKYTSVADDNAVTTTALPDAEVGKAYDFKVKGTHATSSTPGANPWTCTATIDGNAISLDDYGLVFDTSTGRIYGTPTVVPYDVDVDTIDFALSYNGSTTANLSLTIVPATEGLGVEDSTGKDLLVDELDLGTITRDITRDQVTQVKVLNNTIVDFADVTPTITSITIDGGTPITNLATAVKLASDGTYNSSGTATGKTFADFFKVVADENDATATKFEIKKSANHYIDLVRTAPGGILPIGEYDVEVTLSDTVGTKDFADVTFCYTFKVVAAPVIKVPTDNGANGLTKVNDSMVRATIGTAIDNATAAKKETNRFLATLAGATYDLDADLNEVTFSYVDEDPTADEVTAATAAGKAYKKFNLSGISIDSKGVFSGTPEQVGLYKLLVTANVKKDSLNATGTKIVYVEVLPSATLSLFTDGALSTGITTTTGSEAVYVLPGALTSDETLGTGKQIFVKATTANASNVTITVEDADSRTDDEKKDGKENKFEGSKNFIGVSKTNIDSIIANSAESFYVKPLAVGTEDKTYVVKVTVGGATTNPVSFYVEYNVTKPLTLSTPVSGLTAEIGELFKLPITVTGSHQVYDVNGVRDATSTVSQAILFKEVQSTNANASAWNNWVTYNNSAPVVANSENVVDSANSTGTAPLTGLQLYSNAATKEIGAYIGGTQPNGFGYAATDAKGTYDVTLRASVPAATIPANGDLLIDGKKASVRNYVTGDAHTDCYADTYDSNDITFTLTITDSKKVNIVALASNGYDADEIKEHITGTKNETGTEFVEFNGYTFRTEAKGYTNGSQETLTVSVKNSTGSTIAISTLGLTETDSAKQYFTLGGTLTSGSTLSAGATSTFTITPTQAKTSSTVNTYENTVEIKGDGFDTINLDLGFAVEDVRYAASVYTGAAATDDLVEYVDKTGVATGTPMVLNATKKNATPVAKSFVIENTGNVATTVTVTEVKDAQGTKLQDSDTPKLSIATASLSGMAVGAKGSVDIKPASTSATVEPGTDHIAYVKVVYYTKGTTETKAIVPVDYVVYNTSVDTFISIDPAGTTISAPAEFTESKEGYSPATLEKTITITNAGEGDVNALYNVEATIIGTGFEVVDKDDYEGIATTTNYSIDKIGKGSSSFVVAPEASLSAGTYTGTIKITADNLNAPIYVYVEFVVTESATYTTSVGDRIATSGGAVILDSSFATRLYNSLYASGIAGALTPVLGASENDVDHYILLDLDGNTAPDLKITFNVDTDSSSVITNMNSGIIEKLSTSLSEPSYTVTLTDAQITALRSHASNATIGRKYFESMTVNVFSTVDLYAGYYAGLDTVNMGYFADEIDDLEVPGKVEAIGIVDADSDTEIDDAVLLRVVVPNGSPIKSAFKNGTLPKPTYKLSSAETSGKAFVNWLAGSNILLENTDITSDYVVTSTTGTPPAAMTAINAGTAVTATWAKYEYAKSNSDTEHVQWTWTKKSDNTYAPEVKFIPTNSTDLEGILTYSVATGVTVNSTIESATCEKGERVVYKGTINFNGVTFTNEKDADEGTPLGHDFDYSVTWTLNDDSKYDSSSVTVTAVCKNNTSHKYTYAASEVTVTEDVKKAATATEAGVSDYTVSVKKIATDWDTSGSVTFATDNFTETKTQETKALGHKYVGKVTKFDEETLDVEVTVTDENDPAATPVVKNVKASAGVLSDDETTMTYAIPKIVLDDGDVVEVDPYVVTLVAFTWTYNGVTFTPSSDNKTRTGATFAYTGKADGKDDKNEVINATRFTSEAVTVLDKEGIVEYTAEISADDAPDKIARTEKVMIDTTTGLEYNSHEHVWGEPEWTITVSGGIVSGTAKFTCTPADTTITPHSETVSIIPGTPETDGSFSVYTITAKDPAGKEYTYAQKVTVDAVGNEVTSEAKTWTAAYATSGLGTDTPSVTITLTGDNGAVDKVTVTPEAKVNGDVTTYSISYKDRAGKTHKMSWDYKKPATEGGEPTITPGTEKTSGTDASKADGEISVSFAVDPDTDEEGNPQFVFTGAAIKPALVIRDEDRDVTLAQGVDYTLKWATNKAVGTAVVTVVGKGNYAGKSVTLSYKIADLKLGTDDFAVKKIKGFGTFTNGTDTGVSAPAYDGNAWTPEEITVTDANGADVVLKLQADGTYASEDSKTTAISIANNVNKGSATVSALNAKGKVVKKTFKIAAANLAAASESDLTFDPDEAVYAAKGAVPANLNVEYKGQELVLGQDYTVKYSYASKTKDAGEKAGMFTITGKGNYAGKAAQKNFDIAALELEDDAAAVSVFDKATVKSIKPTISDGNGVVIPAKQLKVTVVKHGESDDTTLAPKDKVFAGDKLTITVEGVNDKNISEKAEFDVTVAANLGKAKVAVPSGFTKYYTGEAIELTDEDMEKIAVTINKTTTLKYGEDFEIAGYQNNIKKGSMTVTLRGISEKCSGTKTFKVKITAKTMKKAE